MIFHQHPVQYWYICSIWCTIICKENTRYVFTILHGIGHEGFRYLAWMMISCGTWSSPIGIYKLFFQVESTKIKKLTISVLGIVRFEHTTVCLASLTTGNSVTTGLGCWIQVPKCPSHPSTQPFFYDSWGATNAGSGNHWCDHWLKWHIHLKLDIWGEIGRSVDLVLWQKPPCR